MTTVYIAGPIAGHPDHAEKFDAAVTLLTDRGYVPVNPLDVSPDDHVGPCPKYGYHPGESDPAMGSHDSSCCFMRTDIEALLGCDYIYLLPDWERSRGATVEAAVARAVGIPRLVVSEGCAAGCWDVIEEAPHPPQIDARHLERQREWSVRTFGPAEVRGPRGPLDHIRKEVEEVAADPYDLTEWADVIILALDGAWRAGHEPADILRAVIDKQARNEARTWPNWRTADPDKAIEHVKETDR